MSTRLAYSKGKFVISVERIAYSKRNKDFCKLYAIR